MNETQTGRLAFDPAVNPAVLDTLTWDPPSLAGSVSSQAQGFWEKAGAAVSGATPPPVSRTMKVHERSYMRGEHRGIALFESADGQQGLVEFVRGGAGPLLPSPLLRRELQDATAYFHEASAQNVHEMLKKEAPERIPQALGMTPRLGIGTRMSRAMWPGIWQALNEGSFSANGIQNSLRELNLLENVREGAPAQKLYYPGIGFVPEGHTGSTFEGLWLCGVSEALKAGVKRPYGADADHIMVKRGLDGLEKAKRVLLAARNYSFFTIDVSDILDYSALRDGVGPGHAQRLERAIADESIRAEALAYYRKPIKVGGRSIRLSEPELAGLIGKYWHALEAMENLAPFIAGMRGKEPFDLELSVDEHPPEIHPFDCLTTEVEVAFVLEEMKRRGVRLTHIAPNLGVEKHVDYRYRDGLEGLETRTRALHCLARDHGMVIDVHSGDDLSQGTRRALKKATGGALHFKISPYPQTLFADVLYDFDQQVFRLWWNDTREFAAENAQEGSRVAADALKQYDSEAGAAPHPRYALFRLFCYATVGKRDSRGNFLYREKFYSLSAEFYAEYTRRVKEYLCMLAGDLLP